MENLKSGTFLSHSIKIISIFFLFIFTVGILHAQNYQTTKAQKGEGIYSLLKRHGLSPGDYLNDFIQLNKDKLGKDNSLYAGMTYKLPVEPKTSTQSTSTSAGIYPIFGKDYEKVALIDNSLQGAIYYLVSGHGGPDPGAMGHLSGHPLCEDEYAYDVTLRLARCLIEHGALVYMITRDDNDGIRDNSFLKPDKDETCYPDLAIPRSQLKRLRERKDAVNKLYIQHKGSFQRLVITHVDSRSKGENIDVFFYHDKRSKTGKKLANILHQTFKQKYDEYQPNRGYHGSVSVRNLYVLKYSYPPAVFMEIGNINHYRDQQRLIRVNNRQALANWICEGLMKDFKINK
ncbi:MAG TPA: N-acetylmuramoyl-L-alanine amidase [Sunxiuqinia sp.]|nr:N-acetylmuramoyl-L-alanine amidase [Sunxiuqinia sp.]